MKKFVSMAMVAAMTVSMVPATAFAAGDVETTLAIRDDLELTKEDATDNPYITDNAEDNKDDDRYDGKVPELHINVKDASYRNTEPGEEVEAEVTLELDNAEFIDKDGTLIDELDDADAKTALEALVKILYDDERGGAETGTDLDVFEVNDAAGTILSPDGDATPSAEDITVADLASTSTAGAQVVEWLLDAGEELTVDADAAVYYDADTTDFAAAAVKVIDVVDGEAELAVDMATFLGYLDAVIAAAGDEAFVNSTNQDSGNPATELTISTDFSLTVGTKAIDTAYVATFAEMDQDAKIAYYTGKGYVRGDYGTEEEVLGGASDVGEIDVEVKEYDEDSVTYVFTGKFAKDDVIVFDLDSVLDKTTKGRTATVSVSGDLGEAEDMVYASVLGEGITATTKEIGNVAEDEFKTMAKDLKIKSAVGSFADGQIIELKLSNGFEFTKETGGTGTGYELTWIDEDTAEIEIDGTNVDEITIDSEQIEIEAASAKAGDVATLKVRATAKPAGFQATTTVEVMKVVDYKVILSVDEDEDVPVIYSGVNVENWGITDDSDHLSLEVTAEESFPGAWSTRQGFNFELPDGVYVTDVKVTDATDFYVEGDEIDEVEVRDAFWNAYQEADHKGFEFKKRVFDDVNTELAEDCATMTFQLELVADPGFVGDVTLKMTGDLVDEQEVTIAKFATPYYVQAEQNDLKIDYRYTDIPTDIVITEAEAGLWDKDSTDDEKTAAFGFYLEGGHIKFEDDPTFEVTGGLENDDEGIDEDYPINLDGDTEDVLAFVVDEESDEAATVTITDMQLYMERNIPAGPYDLKMVSTLGSGYVKEVLFASDADERVVKVNADDDGCDAPIKEDFVEWDLDTKKDNIIDDVADFSTVVKEAFVNVVTAGREQDDASFTTKVVVPVGESYLVSGENTVDLDVPAYISAAGYTMLPVRAVANGLGISNNNVLWNGETKTVTKHLQS